MSVRIVIIFLLVMVGLALLRGPAFRRSLRGMLGIAPKTARRHGAQPPSLQRRRH